jgi:hypothetical protein
MSKWNPAQHGLESLYLKTGLKEYEIAVHIYVIICHYESSGEPGGLAIKWCASTRSGERVVIHRVGLHEFAGCS